MRDYVTRLPWYFSNTLRFTIYLSGTNVTHSQIFLRLIAGRKNKSRIEPYFEEIIFHCCKAIKTPLRKCFCYTTRPGECMHLSPGSHEKCVDITIGVYYLSRPKTWHRLAATASGSFLRRPFIRSSTKSGDATSAPKTWTRRCSWSPTPGRSTCGTSSAPPRSYESAVKCRTRWSPPSTVREFTVIVGQLFELFLCDVRWYYKYVFAWPFALRISNKCSKRMLSRLIIFHQNSIIVIRCLI